MKKSIVLISFFTIIVLLGKTQDYKIGLRFSPLNSEYTSDEQFGFNSTGTSTSKSVSQFDSLTIGLTFEKYFSKNDFLVFADFSYANIRNLQISNYSVSNNPQYYSNESSNEFTQSIYNLKLGIGTRTNYNKFIFTFGLFVPFSILPEGKIVREIKAYQDGNLQQHTTGLGTYKSTLGFGIGAIGGVSTIINKHISIGMDFTYQINYLARNVDWYGETNTYGTNPYKTYSDESIRIRNYYTSKIIPSIVIAYTFNCKKNLNKNMVD